MTVPLQSFFGRASGSAFVTGTRLFLIRLGHKIIRLLAVALLIATHQASLPGQPAAQHTSTPTGLAFNHLSET